MIIYKITNIVNSKVYIGQTRINPSKERFNRHIRESKKPSLTNYLHLSMRKYGKENFIFEILCSCKNLTDLSFMEKYFISLYNSNNKKFGFNLTSGGEQPVTNEEIKKKLSEKIKNQYLNGRTPWNKGKGIKIYKSEVGFYKTIEHRKKLSISMKKRFLTEKHVQSKNVLCKELNIIFKSATEAAKYFNTSQGCISNICRGERKSLRELNFIYTEAPYNFKVLKGDING